jgi:hypothetical protein
MCSPVNVYGMLVKARRLSHQSLYPHWQAHVLDQAGRAGEGGLIVTGFRVVSASAPVKNGAELGRVGLRSAECAVDPGPCQKFALFQTSSEFFCVEFE